VRAKPFQVVLSDWDMPGLNGLELCRAIRAADPSGNIYIIMVTGRSLSDEQVEGFSAGADAYLTKHFDTEDLLAHIDVARRMGTRRSIGGQPLTRPDAV